MTSRATWERAAEKALKHCGYAQLRGNMEARLDAIFPLYERCAATSTERCLMFLFMACIEDDEDDRRIAQVPYPSYDRRKSAALKTASEEDET